MTSPQQFGRYEIKRELGRGGMATVYLAFDPRFKRDVALKVLPHEFLHDPTFRVRFEREAQTIAALDHPAIVPVFDFGEQDGQPYFVMRYMPGGSLADRLKRGPLSLAETGQIFTRLAPALDEAHTKGIIHRDLKPGNILFDQREDAYLSDFGIVKLSEATSTFTGTGVIGTPAYMSPEQARGEADIDGRSDIYALGAILFEMLTGQTPYKADTPMGLVVKHITEPVPRILDVKPDLPPGCEALITWAMAKNRDERPATASRLAKRLASLARSEPAVAEGARAEASPAVTTAASPMTATTGVRPSPPPTLQPTQNPEISAPATQQLIRRPAVPMAGWIIGGVITIGLFIGALAGGSVLLNMLVRGTPTATVTETMTMARVSTATAEPLTATFTAPPPTNPQAPTTFTDAPPTATATASPTETPTVTPTFFPMQITRIEIENGVYVVYYETSYDLRANRQHVHFFFNTVSPEQAGVPGLGPWFVYYDSSPSRPYRVSDRPANATQMCILIANPDHSVNYGTGNCVDLP